MTTKSLKGQLLIAHPNLKDRMFTRSVVLILEDGTHGTVGVVLNKPSNFHFKELLQLRGVDCLSDKVVHCGGPTNSHACTIVHDDDWYSANTHILQRGLAASSDDFMIKKISTGNEPDNYRVFTGLASWSPRQLAHELIRDNSWLTMVADRPTVFNLNGEQQWEKALEKCSQQIVDNWF